MKSILIAIVLLLSNSISLDASAGEPKHLSDFPVLEEVLDFVNEASYDLDSYFKLVQIDEFQFDGMKCSKISASELKKFVKDKFSKVSNFYPDEGIPFNKAKGELDHYIGNANYQKCEIIENKDKYQIISHYFQSLEDDFPNLLIEFEKRIL